MCQTTKSVVRRSSSFQKFGNFRTTRSKFPTSHRLVPRVAMRGNFMAMPRALFVLFVGDTEGAIILADDSSVEGCSQLVGIH